MRVVLSRLKTKRALVQLAIVIFIICALFYVYKNYSPKHKIAYVVPSPSNSEVAKGFDNSASQLLANKDYQGAANSYVIEASNLMASKKYGQAQTVLLEATKKIPTDQIPWNIYDSLYAVAKAQNDKALEKSSLQKAIEKVSQPDSGQQQVVKYYQDELAKLQ